MANTDLEKMLDAVINNNSDQAEQHFHDFVQQKMKDILQGENQVDDEVVEPAPTDKNNE